MKIGMIGAGNIGGNLTRRFRELGHEVYVANSRGPQTLSELAEETGATPVNITDAVRGVDLIVLTIPMKNVLKLPQGLFADVPKETPVVDTCNYYPRQRDGLIAPIEEGMPESSWVEQQIGHPVIKAFNGIPAPALLTRGVPAGTADRIALPVAGDNAEAKAVVMKLMDDIGFDAIDAGSIHESWHQQPGTPSYVKNYNEADLREALAAASPERSDEWRA